MAEESLNIRFGTKGVNEVVRGMDRIKQGARSMESAVSRRMSGIASAFSKLRRVLFSAQAGFAALAAVLGTAGVAGSFINVSRTTESLRLRLNTMLGSVSEGNRLFMEMSKFAGQVPFEYREIMEASTALSGVVKGGVDEVKQFMPIIADLAAVSGLSIQETTSNVIKMYSAGAGAADQFRERGILAMLGFQAGVSTSAEETRKRLIAAWEDPLSRFRGASEDLATTWDGMLSMISDAWFNFRDRFMSDTGLWDFLKEALSRFQENFVDALNTTETKMQQWGTTVFNVIRTIAVGLGQLADAWDFLTFGTGPMIEFLQRQIIIIKGIFSKEYWSSEDRGAFFEKLRKNQEEFTNELREDFESFSKNRSETIGKAFDDILETSQRNKVIREANTRRDSFLIDVKGYERVLTLEQQEAALLTDIDVILKDREKTENAIWRATEQRLRQQNEAVEKEIDLLITREELFSDPKRLSNEVTRLNRSKEFTEDLKEQIRLNEIRLRLGEEEASIESVLGRIKKDNLDVDKDATREMLEQIREQEKIIEEQEEAVREYEKLWDNAFENMQRSFADTIFNMFDEGLDSFDDFADAVVNIWKRMIAEMVALWITRIVKDLFSGTSIGGLISGLFGGAGAKASPVGAAGAALNIAGIAKGGKALIGKIGGFLGFGGAGGAATATGLGAAAIPAGAAAGTLGPIFIGTPVAAGGIGAAGAGGAAIYGMGAEAAAAAAAGGGASLGASLAAAAPYVAAVIGAALIAKKLFGGGRSPAEIFQDQLKDINRDITSGAFTPFEVKDRFKVVGGNLQAGFIEDPDKDFFNLARSQGFSKLRNQSGFTRIEGLEEGAKDLGKIVAKGIEEGMKLGAKDSQEALDLFFDTFEGVEEAARQAGINMQHEFGVTMEVTGQIFEEGVNGLKMTFDRGTTFITTTLGRLPVSSAAVMSEIDLDSTRVAQAMADNFVTASELAQLGIFGIGTVSTDVFRRIVAEAHRAAGEIANVAHQAGVAVPGSPQTTTNILPSGGRASGNRPAFFPADIGGAHGLDFVVRGAPGIDQNVLRMRVSDRERVRVETGEQQRINADLLEQQKATNRLLSMMVNELRAEKTANTFARLRAGR